MWKKIPKPRNERGKYSFRFKVPGISICQHGIQLTHLMAFRKQKKNTWAIDLSSSPLYPIKTTSMGDGASIQEGPTLVNPLWKHPHGCTQRCAVLISQVVPKSVKLIIKVSYCLWLPVSPKRSLCFLPCRIIAEGTIWDERRLYKKHSFRGRIRMYRAYLEFFSIINEFHISWSR